MADENDFREKHKTVTIEVTTVDEPTPTSPREISGWGEHGHVTAIIGKAVVIHVKRDGESEFGVRILEDGSIILTSYRACLEPQILERNLRFANTRPWNE